MNSDVQRPDSEDEEEENKDEVKPLKRRPPLPKLNSDVLSKSNIDDDEVEDPDAEVFSPSLEVSNPNPNKIP